ncbi:MAG: anaerobic ribonucleoside-triphosphate reductase activating protein [Candidatus Aenigmatarchaeota archaeon]
MDEKIKLGGILDFTTVDWPGKIASIVFLYGCNFKCPYCFNSDLVIGNSFKEIEISKIVALLKSNKDFVDSVVICGGEPTIHGEKLVKLCSLLKESGFKIKLDTNGSNPELVEKLIKNKLIDFVALDIKSDFQEKNYERASGGFTDMQKIKNTLNILINSNIEYECRIPVIPNLNQHLIKNIAKEITQAKTVVLEQYISSDKTIDKNFKIINSPSREELINLAKFFKNEIVKIRTKEMGEEILTS